MERLKTINMQSTKTQVKTKSKIRINSVNLAVAGLVIFFMSSGYYFLNTMQRLQEVSKATYILEEELKKIVEENSVLEAVKADSLNMREVQKKAEELGFIYNNDINYIK